MDEATRKWEAGARARLAGGPEPQDDRRVREGYFTADWLVRKWLSLAERGEWGFAARQALRLAALWLEHRAQQLELEAVGLLAEGKGVEAERAQDNARALEVAAAYVRRELLGEEG